LAGLIAVRSNDPEQEAHFGAEGSVAEYNTRSLGGYATAPVESLNSAWRLSVQQYRSDSFMDNTYLHRKDTNDRDELTGRFKWQWQISDVSTLDFTLLHADLDNGYDGGLSTTRAPRSPTNPARFAACYGSSVRYRLT
jgi:hypothetical protein